MMFSRIIPVTEARECLDLFCSEEFLEQDCGIDLALEEPIFKNQLDAESLLLFASTSDTFFDQEEPEVEDAIEVPEVIVPTPIISSLGDEMLTPKRRGLEGYPELGDDLNDRNYWWRYGSTMCWKDHRRTQYRRGLGTREKMVDRL